MRYYLNDEGGWLTASGSLLLGSIPDGYREVTEEQFNAAAGVVLVNAPD